MYNRAACDALPVAGRWSAWSPALALYVTRGVLDETVTGGERVRVAFLPPWESLLGFMCLGGARSCVGIDHLQRAARHRRGERPLPDVLVRRSFALGVCCSPSCPFSPTLSGRCRSSPGPLRWRSSGWWSRRSPSGPGGTPSSPPTWRRALEHHARSPWPSASPPRWCRGAAARLTGTVLYPAGDEPHYLVIAQSLWRDGDLKIENNHGAATTASTSAAVWNRIT